MGIILPDGTEVREIVEQVDWLTENHTSGEASGDNWSTITIDGVTKNIPTGGGGGTSDFDQLSNRPKYNGSAMTHETNIPEVKTATWDGKSVVSGQSSDGNWTSITIDGTTKSIPQGGGSTYTAGDGLTLTNNEFDVVCGDGIEIDTDDKVAAKIGRGIFFDSDNAIALNNNAYNAINAVSSKLDATQLSGTHDGTNWTTLQIKGTTKNIPTGGGGGTTTEPLVFNMTDQSSIEFDGSDTVNFSAGSNITLTRVGNAITISATGGGGTSSHLYRHDIRLEYPDGNSEIVTFSLYHASSTTLTFAQIRDMLPTNYSIPAAGNNNDGSIYNGVRKDNSDIRADTVFYDSQLECFDYGYDVIDLNWNLTDTVTTIF